MPTILENLKSFFQDMRKSKELVSSSQSSEMNTVFRFRYTLFKEMLAANSELLAVFSDIDEKLKGEQVFGFSYIHNQVNKSLRSAFQMAKCLNVMSNAKYQGLYESLARINEQVTTILDEKKAVQAPFSVALYSDISLADADWVGGKNANLGEMSRHLNIPIPKGFAITTKAFHHFLDHNDLKDEIISQKNLIYTNELELLNNLSNETIELIQSKPLPSDLEEEILGLVNSVWPDGQEILLAMRSSAVGEDGDISYAGQYLTQLGVRREEICSSYKAIIASLYSARSISYRSSKGIYDENLAMAVACLQMVDSCASGVMYTCHPYDITNKNILINAVWGLGPYAVDGMITPDVYSVAKNAELTLLEQHASTKPVRLVLNKEGGVHEEPVPEEQRGVPCLSAEQLRLLAGYGVALERHYKCPQDVEWAMNHEGEILILQSRPLQIQNPKNFCLIEARPLPGYDLLVNDGEIASQGAGTGLAVHVHSTSDLTDFPEGGVLIARHSSPEYVVIMRRCSAILVEAGSVSGHMAALAREFGVPTLIAQRTVMEQIPVGTEITVDAYTGRVYAGKVVELMQATQRDEACMKGTPVYEHLERVAELVLPLNLVNPAAPEFAPENCRTLHDLTRFCHEHSYSEMFQISDLASKHHGWSLKLDAALPMDIHLIDLGNGLVEHSAIRRLGVQVDQIASAPFSALLKGMLNKDVHNLEPRPVNFSGLMAVIKQQSMEVGHHGNRFGDRSYAIIADKYLNFSSRVGYHYSVLDAYCGDTINKNYITFTFKGGAADSVRKNRRVRAISRILEEEGYKITVKGDKVDARLQKYPKSFMEERIESLGKLLIFTRQLDMLMTSEETVEWVAHNFLTGNYRQSIPPPATEATTPAEDIAG